MNIKTGVQVAGIQPEILLALRVAEEAYHNFNASQSFVITSISDPAPDRVEESKHPKGYAVDLRTRGLNNLQQKWIAELIDEKLTDEYTVLLEEDHIHIHFNVPE